MKRVVASSLVLVNWRGVFYQRYALDPRVTALEGANGAGKTTVMIAAYVVLLPDMSLLRFTNVGEHGATGGDRGLYGRLGESGSPTYAALDLQVGSERLIAGVLLERRAEPSVDLTPFVISGLPGRAQLQELFLERPAGERAVDRVPLAPKLRELATKAGGKLEIFASAKDYFTRLFDLGVTPLRLTADDERKKYNEMLRTSMMGGISRTLAEGLRGFLLKEETHLADTLRRMRQNLEACRRTRTEVRDARQIEAEITDVYDAGLRLFAAAVHATRERAEELHAHVLRARSVAAEVKATLMRTTQDHDAAISLRDEARVELEALGERARMAERALNRLREANRLHARIVADEEVEATRREEHELADAARLAAEETQASASATREQAREAHTRAARGLADFKQGFEELERRAAEHRLVVNRLDEARTRLPAEEVRIDTLAPILARCAERLAALDEELAELARQLAVAGQLREAFARLHATLERLVGEPVAPAEAHGRGERCLADLREREALAREKDSLAQALKEARERQGQQSKARADARAILGADASLTSEALHLAHKTGNEETRALADEILRVRGDLEDAGRRVESAQQRVRVLARERERWAQLRRTAEALSQRHQRPAHSRHELNALRELLEGERDGLRSERDATDRERDRVAAEILRLEHSGGHFESALLRARDHVGAELLASRFDEVPLGEAGELQARLGPLHAALVVDDLHDAARRLSTLRDRPETIWLVGQDAPLDLTRGSHEKLEHDLLVHEISGARLTRIPETPTLGRRARQRRIEELRAQEAALASSSEALARRENELARSLRELIALLPEVDLLERTDPQQELGRVQREHDEAAQTQARLSEALATLGPRRTAADQRLSALVKLLPVAHLLDLPDLGAEALRLGTRLAEAGAAAELLRRCAADREALTRGLLTLLRVPPSDEELAAMRARQQDVVSARDVLQRASSALTFVRDHAAALAWTDAEAALLAKVRLKPALEQQLELARRQLDAAEVAASAAERAVEETTRCSNTTDAALKAIVAALADQRGRFVELGVEDASDAVLAEAEGVVRTLTRRHVELTADERELSDKAATWAERLRGASKQVDDAERDLAEKTRAWEPERANWEALRDRAEGEGLLAVTASAEIAREMLEQGSVNLWGKVRSYTALLTERLRKTRDGGDLGERARQTMDGPSRTASSALEVWLDVREWLRRRVPAQIAEVDEPLAALARLREYLVRLEGKLEEQEETLRGETNDVARNIETAIRKARHQIGRLNHELDRVRFGSIRGVRIRVDPVERMQQVLDALKGGQAQELLWKSGLTIEDALDALFQQVGGGKISGQRLLDYREYLGLVVEVTRLGSAVWEVANPTRMSTGEAIGVGAALMMVVLTAWERDANLLRAKRALGTLRILFLDEANRLSQDNLAILFDLCESLELQLLLAAPEVARAEGNTTYRLVRQVEAGREEVLVSGRRIAAGSA